MNSRPLTRVLGVAIAATWALVGTPVPGASAEPLPDATNPGCSDVEVVFARGTGEAPGVGYVGQAFVDSLQSKVGPRSVGVYAVNYPATIDFPQAVVGVNDASAHIQATAASCPKTKIVLGGYSQGAAVAGFVTADVVPPGAVDYAGSGPMPPAIADHVAAVALFGKPAHRFMGFINQPDVVVGPLYTAKTLDSCVPGDPICSDAGGDYSLHDQYVSDGLVDQAVDFTVSKLGPARTPPKSPGATPEPIPTPSPALLGAAPGPVPAPVGPAPGPVPAPAPLNGGQ